MKNKNIIKTAMKNIILSVLFVLFVTGIAESQVKTRIFLANPTIEAGLWSIDVRCTVPAGQTWRVGSCNIRINWATTPNAASVSIHPDATVSGANPLLNNNGNYGIMTTTSILGGATISLNVVRLGAFQTFAPGTYSIGRIRFNRLDTTNNACIRLTQRTTGTGPSVIYDSLTLLAYSTGWDTLATNPPGCIRLDYLTGIEGSISEMPTVFKLYTNYPNPFNPSTTIKYDIPRNAYVKISIYDVLGQLVTDLVKQDMTQGRYEILWNAQNFASGSYYYKMEAGDYTEIKKMILVK